MMNTAFESASFHIVKPCNMRCKFCYATFQDMSVIKQLSIDDTKNILTKLFNGGVRKITFAGGEPLLYKNLKEALFFSKKAGFTTSIITNGSFLTESFLLEMKGILDWVGLSVDSLSEQTNILIGRIDKSIDYQKLVYSIKNHGYKLKINTVVNRFNEQENMQIFIENSNPIRWKIFDTLKVEGQNDKDFDEIRSIDFKSFVDRHNHSSMVVEDNEAMTGSYLLIDPRGRLFENSAGRHTYSKPLQNSTIEECLSEISLNRSRFIQRGGLYKW